MIVLNENIARNYLLTKGKKKLIRASRTVWVSFDQIGLTITNQPTSCHQILLQMTLNPECI